MQATRNLPYEDESHISNLSRYGPATAFQTGHYP